MTPISKKQSVCSEFWFNKGTFDSQRNTAKWEKIKFRQAKRILGLMNKSLKAMTECETEIVCLVISGLE